MKMKKFINNPENLTDELLDGLVAANRNLIHRGEENMIINNALENADRASPSSPRADRATNPPSPALWAKAWWISRWWATSSPLPVPRPA